jgi:ectoine hydroxylase-related dioxygenase (phytanoyl-CoA dioxygenase family)
MQDAWTISTNIKKIATFPQMLQVLRALYNRRPMPFQTLNFPRGTEQKIHADNIHFNSEPFGLMCGVWVALEDIGADQGPLIYYPGSHKLPEMNFEDVGLEPGMVNYPQYETYIEKLVAEQRFPAELGIVKKGTAIIWSANLLHGGSMQFNKALSRHSQVTHYFFEGSRYWRPAYSKQGRHYFDPLWIPFESGGIELTGLSRIKHSLRTKARQLQLRSKKN